MAQGRLWTRTFIVLMGINFCSALSFYLIMVKIVEYSMETYDATYSAAGFMITVYVIAALVTRLLFGRKIDQWGVKRALAIGTGVNLAAMLLYLLPLGYWPLMAVRVLHGFGFALMSGASSAGAALVIPRERYGEGIGYFSMMQALATGVGPFIAIFITNLFGGYFPLFAFSAAVAALAFAGISLLKIPKAEHPSSSKAPDEQTAERGIGALVQLVVVPLSSVLFLAYIGYAGILSFLTVYAGELGLSDAVSLYFVVYAVVILVSRPPVGRRVDRLGENSTMYISLISLVAGFILLAASSNAVMLLLSAAFVGFGIGTTQSVIQAVIARDTPQDELGRANSTFMMSMDLGSGVGPVLIGAVIPLVGYRFSYLGIAGVALLALLVYHLVHGRTHRR